MIKNGFTLIELMITVAVIGILAAIAYPSYQDSVRKTRRAEAQAIMIEYASFAERSFTENNNYASATQDGAAPIIDDTTFYNFTVVVSAAGVTPQTYDITAAPLGAQANDTCGTMTLDETNVRTSGQAGCW
jgi:type IV pilus assembly protein PilE